MENDLNCVCPQTVLKTPRDWIWVPFRNPVDLPEQLATNLDSGSLRAPANPCDVCMLVKQYISSKSLAQKPLRVMTPARASRVGMIPAHKYPANSPL